MSEYVEIVLHDRRGLKRPSDTYSWETHLRAFERQPDKQCNPFVPVEAFNQNLLVNFNDIVREDVICEVVNHDYDNNVDNVEVRWFVRVEKVCGYRALVQFIGSNSKFWMHLLSDEVYSLANATMADREMWNVAYIPPLDVNEEYSKDMRNFIQNCFQCYVEGQPAMSPRYDEHREKLHAPRFRVGQRLELLNYQDSIQIRVARIHEICGRRINVAVSKVDYPKNVAYPNRDQDRQCASKKAQYWIDEDSFFIFPVGFAAINKLKLLANDEYKLHTKRIAEAITEGKMPEYQKDDITFDDLKKDPVDQEKWRKLKIGMKFELVDPLAQQFKILHVASILKFCTTDGYIIVGMDGPDAFEDSFPIHINNLFMFPVGYAEEYRLELEGPESKKGEFVWADYLKEEKAEPLPMHLFRPMPPAERLDKFKVGMRLEAADMCENHYICPATIKSVHGRLINVNFDGWEAEYDELYDIDSHDILPIGWCELHSYKLQEPKPYS